LRVEVRSAWSGFGGANAMVEMREGKSQQAPIGFITDLALKFVSGPKINR
jgi:hypothetical protein